MKDLIANTLEKIKNEHIRPEAKWKYILKKYAFWLIFGLFLALGVVSFATAIAIIFNLDWNLYAFCSKNSLIYNFSILPYFWLILILFFLGLAFWDIRISENGYRFNRIKILFSLAGALFLLAIGISFFGLGEKVDQTLRKKMPYYAKHLTITKEAQWSQPEKGFLAGTISSVNEKEIKLIDSNGNLWKISITEDTFIKPSASLVKNEKIKVIGSLENSETFHAKEIRTWGSRGNRQTSERNGLMMGK
jgi:hypothetical protein